MAEKYFPFNSVSGDREYYADDFAAFFRDIISSGVSANGDNIGVTAAGGLKLLVGPGLAWIRGHLYRNTTTKSLTIEAGGSLPRIDRVVARLMVAERKIETMVVAGTPDADPEPPVLTRTDDYWDIGIAEISVAASAISVDQADITDTRTDNEVCGVVRCAVDNLDVGAFMKASRADFLKWLGTLKDMLDDNQAGHLQNQIDAIRDDLDNGVYTTTAIVNLHTVPGAIVKMSQEEDEIEATADASGLAILHPNKLGIWDAIITTSNGTYPGVVEVTVIGVISVSLPTFEAMAWADINAVAQAGAGANVFNRGDEKDIVINGEEITLRIEDFDHDDLPAGGKANITIAMRNLFTETQRMNPTSTNVGSWNSSELRGKMPTYLSQLPADLRAAIKPVIKKTTRGNQLTSTQQTTDSLWLFASVEVGTMTTNEGYRDEGTPYPLFVDDESRIKHLSNGEGVANNYWLRSPHVNTATYFRIVNSSGANYTNIANSSNGVCLGLCI